MLSTNQFYDLICLTVVVVCVGWIFYLSMGRAVEKLALVDLNKHLDPSQLLEKVKLLQTKLHECMIGKEYCRSDLAKCTASIPVSSESADVPSRSYDTSGMNYKQIGFVYNNTNRFPLYARAKYPGRSDKWEYYIIDDSRNFLRIEIKPKNDNELYNGDTFDAPAAIGGGTYTAEIYPYNSFKYVG